MATELSIIEPKIDVHPSPITISNQEQVEKAVSDFVAQYGRDFVVTPDNIKETKKMRAQLNKVAKAIDEKRLGTNREYKKPVTQFDTLMKGYQKQVLAIMEPLDIKIEEVEELARQERLDGVKATIDEMAPNFGVAPSDIPVRPNWLNKSTTNKQLVDEISSDMKQLKKDRDQRATDIQTIRTYADQMEIESSGWVSMLGQGASVTDILTDINKAVAKRDQEAKDAAERKRKDEEAARAIAESHQIKQGGETIDTETGEVVLQSTMLKLTGTHAQLLALRQWIDANGIKYERVDQ